MSRRSRLLAFLSTLVALGCAAPNRVGPPKTAHSDAPASAASPGVTPASPVASAALAPVSTLGQVLGLDGKPAAGVEVRGFLVSDQGGVLIANNGGSLVSNNGGGLGSARAYVAPQALVTTTDRDGRFELSAPAGQTLNVEAAQSAQVKAIALRVAATRGLLLQLAPTGTLAGRVVAPGVSDLTGADVFIPGTSYAAKTDAHGQYALSEVPVGRFELVASKTGVGRANAKDVAVASGETSNAPDLTLQPVVPEIAEVTPANGGVGAELTVTGRQFGATTGDTFSVTIGGATVTAPRRVDDQTLSITVPSGADSGDVVVVVDGIGSHGAPFTLIKDIAFLTSLHDLLAGETHQTYVEARDPQGRVIASPAIGWKSSGPTATVDVAGRLTAVSAGTATLSAFSGTTSSSPFPLTVYGADATVVTTLAGVATESYVERSPGPIVYEGVGTGVELFAPKGVDVDRDGTVLLADNGGWISRIDLDGKVSRVAPLEEASGITVAEDGTLYATGGHGVFKIDAAAHTATRLAGGTTSGAIDGPGTSARFSGPEGLTVGPDGALYVADAGNHSVRRIDLADAAHPVTTIAGGTALGGTGYLDGDGTAARLNRPTDVERGPGQSLWIADFGAGRVRRLDLGDARHPVTTLAGYDGLASSGSYPPTLGPFGLAADAAGGVYLTEPGFGGGYIRHLGTDGTVSTVAGAGSYYARTSDGAGDEPGFAYLYGIARQADGMLYVAEAGYERMLQRVRRVRPGTGK